MMMCAEVLHGGEMAGDTLVTETAAPAKALRAKGCRTWLAVLLMMISTVQVVHSVIVTDAWMDALSDSHSRLISMRFRPAPMYGAPEVVNSELALTDAKR